MYAAWFRQRVSPTIVQFAPEALHLRISYQVAPEAGSHSTHSAHPHATPCRLALQVGPDRSNSGGVAQVCARSDVGNAPTLEIKRKEARVFL